MNDTAGAGHCIIVLDEYIALVYFVTTAQNVPNKA